MSDIDAVLDFWVGTPNADGSVPEETSKRWWKKDPEFDAEIRARFGELLERAKTGELSSWTETPRGRVALVILLDQFSRNIHRDSPRAFEQDALARSTALAGIDAGEHLELPPMLAYFLLMPLMHAEDLATQERGVALFGEMAARTEGAVREKFVSGVDYAKRHRDIVARFGRFPHRNAVLGRESTDEEREFLKQPGSSF